MIQKDKKVNKTVVTQKHFDKCGLDKKACVSCDIRYIFLSTKEKQKILVVNMRKIRNCEIVDIFSQNFSKLKVLSIQFFLKF